MTQNIEELFNKVKVTHGIQHLPFAEINSMATEEWLSAHDELPTLEDIDAAITEYREEAAANG